MAEASKAQKALARKYASQRKSSNSRSSGLKSFSKSQANARNKSIKAAQKKYGGSSSTKKKTPTRRSSRKSSPTRKSSNSDLKRYQTQMGVASDGIFGKNTKAAVRKFQAKHGLKVDGIIGKNTRAKFNAISGTSMSAPKKGVVYKKTGGDTSAEAYKKRNWDNNTGSGYDKMGTASMNAPRRTSNIETGGDTSAAAYKKRNWDNDALTDGPTPWYRKGGIGKRLDLNKNFNFDPSAMSSDIAQDRVDEAKSGLAKYDLDKNIVENKIESPENVRTDLASIVPQPTPPKESTDSGSGVKIESSVSETSIVGADSTIDAANIENERERIDELNLKKAEEQVKYDLERSSYMETLEILTSNDEAYNKAVKKRMEAEKRYTKGYAEEETIKKLLEQKDEALEDLKEMNDAVLGKVKNGVYNMMGFRFETSSGLALTNKMAENNQEKYKELSGEYDGVISAAKKALADKDMALMDKYWNRSTQIKRDIAGNLKTEYELQFKINAENRAEIKLTMDRGEYQATMRSARAKQLGAMIAANPGLDIDRVLAEKGWKDFGIGGKAMANNEAITVRNNQKYKTAQINAMNRSNRPKPTSGIDRTNQKRIEKLAKWYTSKAGGGLNPLEAEMKAIRAYSQNSNVKKPLDLTGMNKQEREEALFSTGAGQRNEDKKTFIASSNAIVQAFEQSNSGSILIGEPVEFQSSPEEIKRAARSAAEYYNMDKKSQGDFNEEFDRVLEWIQENTLKDGKYFGEVIDAPLEVGAVMTTGAAGAVNLIGEWVGSDFTKPNVLENSVRSLSENNIWEYEKNQTAELNKRLEEAEKEDKKAVAAEKKAEAAEKKK